MDVTKQGCISTLQQNDSSASKSVARSTCIHCRLASRLRRVVSTSFLRIVADLCKACRECECADWCRTNAREDPVSGWRRRCRKRRCLGCSVRGAVQTTMTPGWCARPRAVRSQRVGSRAKAGRKDSLASLASFICWIEWVNEFSTPKLWYLEL